MPSISIAELRQNPAPTIEAVESGQSFYITRYRHPVARLVPASHLAVRGVDVMRALEMTPVDENWATELNNDRDADNSEDAWVQQ